ncbi:MAG TPA: SDR family NAD(P)-dependent oxidoreductase, partial [Candidatus Limnocylindrales bacterium]|nr:SDR family NAD(P)-dependent oxidoreductase [Candidatus Limnocylindrales bacterium]
EHKILLVTGGGRGIGAATALLAAERGYAVAVNYLRRSDEAEAAVNKVRNRGGRAIAVQADVSSEKDVARMFKTVDRELGPVTALVNNAGTLELQSPIENMDAARLRRVFETNVIGSFLCAREAVRRMSTDVGARVAAS